MVPEMPVRHSTQLFQPGVLPTSLSLEHWLERTCNLRFSLSVEVFLFSQPLPTSHPPQKMSFSKAWEPLKGNHQRKQGPYLPVSMGRQGLHVHEHKQQAQVLWSHGLTSSLLSCSTFPLASTESSLVCVLDHLHLLWCQLSHLLSSSSLSHCWFRSALGMQGYQSMCVHWLALLLIRFSSAVVWGLLPDQDSSFTVKADGMLCVDLWGWRYKAARVQGALVKENCSVSLSWAELLCLHIILQHHFNLDSTRSLPTPTRSPLHLVTPSAEEKWSSSVNAGERRRKTFWAQHVTVVQPTQALHNLTWSQRRLEHLWSSSQDWSYSAVQADRSLFSSPFSSPFSFQSSTISWKSSSTACFLSHLPALLQ